MCGSKTTSQTDQSSSYSPPPEVMAEYQDVVNKAQGVAGTPYQSYGGDLVAGINPQQKTGIGAVNAASGIENPYNTGATGFANASAGAIDPTQYSAARLQQYESPYLSDVIKATEAQIQNQNQQQSASLTSGAIGSGAFGGDRAGIAQAALAGQQDIASNATLANLYNQNFEQAQGEFNTQQGVDLSARQNTAARQLAAAGMLGQLGQTAQGEALNEANAQTNAGTLEQTTQQAKDTAAYNQFLQRQAYPFETTGWLANIVEGIGSQSGGSSTGQTTTEGNSGSQIAGGLLGLASFLARGGRVPHRAGGGGIYLPQFFDPTNLAGPTGIGGGSIVPTTGQLAVGHTMPTQGAPSAPATPSAAQQGQSMAQMAKAVQGAGKGLGNAFENSPLGDAYNDAQQDATIPVSEGGTLDDGVLAGGPDLGLGGIGMMARGGIVRPHYAIGGAPAGFQSGFQLNGAPRPGAVAAPGAITQAPAPAPDPGTASPGGAGAPPTQGPPAAAADPSPGGIVASPPTQPVAPTQPGPGGIAPGPISPGRRGGHPVSAAPPQSAPPAPAPAAPGSLNYGTLPDQSSTPPPPPSPFSVGSSNYGTPPSGPPRYLPPQNEMFGWNSNPGLWTQQPSGAPGSSQGNSWPSQNYGGIAPPGNPSFFARGGIVGRPHYDDGGLVPSGDPMFDMSPESLLLDASAPSPPANQPPAPPVDNPAAISPGALSAADIPAPHGISNAAMGGPDAAAGPANVPLPPARPADLGAAPPASKTPSGIAAPMDIGAGALPQIAPVDIPGNNPGNLESNAWTKSLPGYTGASGRFATFATPEQGASALDRNLQSYGAHGIGTPLEITSKWAPKGDGKNDPVAYAGVIAKNLGIGINDPVDLSNPSTRAKIGQSIAQVEHGLGAPALAYDGGRTGINAPAAAAIDAHAVPAGIAAAPSVQASAPQFPDSVPTPDSGRTGLFGLNLSPDTRQLMLSAGLGIMGANGRSFLGNVGTGALTGIAAARQNANLSSEAGLRQAQTQGAQIENQMKARQLKAMMDALDGHADSIAGAADGAPSPTAPTLTAPGVTAAGGSGQKQVDPNFDPVALRALSDRLSIAGPMFKDRADRAAAQAAAIMSGDQQVRFTDGSTGYYPGVGEAKAAQSSAVTAANEQAKVPAAQAQKDIETAHNDSTQAQTALYRLQEMNEQVKNLPTKGFLAPGAYAGERGNLARGLNTVSSIFGGQPIADPNNVAALEELSKDKFRLGAELSRQIGGKEPGFIVQSAVTANPGAENSAVGYRRIVNGLTQAMIYRNDHASFVPDYYKKNGNTTDVETAFQKSHPISMYVERALTSAVDPRDAAALKGAGKDPEAAAIFDKKYGKGVAGLLAKHGYDVSDGMSP